MKRVRSSCFFLIFSVSFVALFMVFSPLSAIGGMTFTVNDMADAVDFSPGDGVCETAAGNGVCTLRAAIQESNSLPGPDSIQLPSGTYTLTIPGIDTTAAAGDLDILDDLSIVGAGADQTIIDGNRLDRVIHVVCANYGYPIVDSRNQNNQRGQGGQCPTDITVSISRVTIQNGLTQSTPAGAGIFNSATLIIDNTTIRDNEAIHGTGGQSGAGIANYGVLTMTHSLVTSNTSNSGFMRGAGLGLGVVEDFVFDSQTYILESQISGNNGDGITIHCCANAGADLTIERSRVSDNSGYGLSHDGDGLIINESEIVNNSSGGVAAFQVRHGINIRVDILNSTIQNNEGAGGVSITDGDLSIANSTISNNSGENNGGAIHVSSKIDEVTMTNVTISHNSAITGGGIYVNSDEVEDITITNSIISNNTGGNCNGVMAANSAGNNLEDGTDCNFTAPGDTQNTDPMLGPLQNNGGSTNTHALLPGSPAADAGNDTVCQSPPVNSLDQRRYSRVDKDGNMDGGADGNPCDIGAYEISDAPTSVQVTADIQEASRNSLFLIPIGIIIIGLLFLIGRGLSNSLKSP